VNEKHRSIWEKKPIFMNVKLSSPRRRRNAFGNRAVMPNS
jgi:hypothetical protein